MIYTAPFTDNSWMNIVDHYFDHVHWIGELRNKQFNNPVDWIQKEYNAVVDMKHRVYIFSEEQKRNWFVMRWL